MTYPVRPRQWLMPIVTTNAEESAESEVADIAYVKAKGRIVQSSTKTNYAIDTFSSQMSEEELSSQDDRAYPDNREEVTIVKVWCLKGAK